MLPGLKVLFPCTGNSDPPRLAETLEPEEQALGHYRRVRDEIPTLVESLPGRSSGDRSRNPRRGHGGDR